MTKLTDPAIHEQASLWVFRLRAGHCTAADRQALKEWLESDRRHEAAYRLAESAWRSFSHAGEQPHPQLVAARLLFRHTQSRRRKTISGRIAAAASLLLLIVGGPVAWQWTHTENYATVKGQRSEILLSDGSRVELNTDTQIRVNYAWRTRKVTMERGEALFTVAHDSEKTFEVIAAKGRIRDIGTRFNVRRWRDETTVSVLEGEVAVSTESSSIAENLLPGRQVRFNNQGSLSAPAEFDPKTVTAWQSGLLAFKSTPLAEVLDELSRYHNVELTLADPALRELKVSGDFPSNDLNGALNVITAALPVKAVRKSPGLIVLEH